jgi:hypothetical protein
MVWRLRMIGCVRYFLWRFFSGDWLTAGQHTGWLCDQPLTINNTAMHIKKVPRTPS